MMSDGLVPNNAVLFVTNTSEAPEKKTDDALIPLPLHSTKQTPEKTNEPTTPPAGPDPIAAVFGALSAVTVEFEIVRRSITEVPFSVDDDAPPLPIAVPDEKLDATTVDPRI
jgi:hypothetical protein